jgi:hypothetical protein
MAPGFEDLRISRESAFEGGEVVSATLRPILKIFDAACLKIIANVNQIPKSIFIM